VEALLSATARILVAEGYDRASTNKIAAKAGVSVGSLYQYFPSKEALVAALIDRHSQEMMAILRKSLEDLAHLSLQQAVKELIRAMVRAHQVEPKLHAVLTEQTPRVGRLQKVHEVNTQAAAMIRERLEEMHELILPKNISLAAFILVNAVEAATHGLVLERPSGFDEEELIEELSALVIRYLLGT
jgi:AcrR family transcriptional regulator